MRRPAHRSLLTVAVLIVLTGCYATRVTVPEPDPATDFRHETVHSLFWGLIQDDVEATDCVSNAIDELRVRTNLGYSLLSILTLGFWIPMDVEWRCAREATTVDPPPVFE